MTDVRVRLLGDVAVEQNGVVAPSGSAAMRTLLALLALDPGAPVAADALVDQLWPDGHGPRHPEATLHTRVTRVRHWLGNPKLLAGRAGAYVLMLPRHAIDLAAFHAAADRAHAVGDAPSDALAAADQALALWVGDPFPGLEGPRIAEERGRARDRRLAVVQQRARALIDLGRGLDAVDAVRSVADAQPLVETLQALRIEALDRAGRPREAVEAYLATCRTLKDELAVGPGGALRAAYHRVVDGRSTASCSAPRRPAMVGRDAPLRSVLDALAGDGRLAIVEGEAGVGKSVLLAAARHGADEAGALVVAGAWQDDVTPMAAWFEALGWPPASVARTPGPWLRDRLRALAQDAPVLLTLDDAHRADSGSLGVLTMMARSGVPAGVVVVVAARTPDAVAHDAWDAARAELQGASQVVRLGLGVLERDDVRAVAASRLARFGRDVAARLADLVAERSGGHPLHASALLDVLETQPDVAAAHEAARCVPERLLAVIRHQVAQLPAVTRTALEALAVLAPVDLAALAAVLDRAPLALAADLRPAVDAGVAVSGRDRVVVRHDLVADAVRDAVPPSTAAELHRTRLDQLPADADPFVGLRHGLGAAAVLPAPRLARIRLTAGIAAFRLRAFTEALALLDDAALELADDVELAVHRGLVLGAMGRADEADAVLDAAVADLLETGSPSEALLVLAAVGDEPLGRTVVGDPRRRERLRRIEPRCSTPAARFELLAAVVREETLSGDARPDAMAEMRVLAAAEPVGSAVRARSRALEARAFLGSAVSAHERLGAAADAFALAEELDDPLLRLDATELLMTATLGAGQVERAMVLRAGMAAEALRWHRPRLVWAGHLVASALMLADGDVEGGDAAALAGLERGRELGVVDALQAYGAHLMVRHWLLGTADELVALAESATVNAPTIPAWCASAAVARARAGDPLAARRHLDEFRRRRAATDVRLFDRPGLCMAAGAAFSLGCSATARLVLDELPADPDAVVLVGYGAVVVGPETLFTGLAAWTLGDVRTARTGFAAAERLASGLGWAPWADAARRLGAALDGTGDLELPLGLGKR